MLGTLANRSFNNDLVAVPVEMRMRDHGQRLGGDNLCQRALFPQFFTGYVAAVEDFMASQAVGNGVCLLHHLPRGPIRQHKAAIPVDDDHRLGNRLQEALSGFHPPTQLLFDPPVFSLRCLQGRHPLSQLLHFLKKRAACFPSFFHRPDSKR